MINQFLGDEFLLVFETFVSYQTTLKDQTVRNIQTHMCIYLARKELIPVNAHPMTIVLQLFIYICYGWHRLLTVCLFLNNGNINNYFNNSKKKSKPFFSN